MPKLFSWNVNGIRAAATKGLVHWIGESNADVVALQEIKATPDQLESGEWAGLIHPHGLHSFWNPAQKLGYSGTAIYTREEPLSVRYGLGDAEIDAEGRVLTVEIKPGLFVVNAYFPNSQREGVRLPFKLRFCDLMLKHLKQLEVGGGQVILCGDYNIAHTAIDLKNPKTNEKNAGYLPEERAWMTQLLGNGFTDIFRKLHPDHRDAYTWWSYRPGIRDRNIGWRIDYHCVSASLEGRVHSAWLQPEVKGSDHCPVGLQLLD